MEFTPVVDETLKIKGVVDREWAERIRLCHVTVLLIPVLCESKKVALQIRPEGGSYAGYYDFFGGHVALDREFWGLLLGEKVDLASLVWSTAVRKANEELRVTGKNGYPEIVSEKDLRIIGNIGEFAWNGIHNVERSTLFLVRIPQGCSIHPMEDMRGRNVRLKTEFLTLDEVVDRFEKHEDFADGARRILLRIKEDSVLFQEIIQTVDSICQQ